MTHRDNGISTDTLLLGAMSIILAVLGWNLITTYNLNAKVAQHAILLSDLKETTDDMKTEVDYMSRSKIWQEATGTALYSPNMTFK